MKRTLLIIIMLTGFLTPLKAEAYPSCLEVFRFYANASWESKVMENIPLRPYKYRNCLRLPKSIDGSEGLVVYMTVSYRPEVPEEKLPKALQGKGVHIRVPNNKLPEILRVLDLNDDVNITYLNYLEGWIPQTTGTFLVEDPDPFKKKTVDTPIIENTN